MPVFEVELSDGRIVELESDTQPDEQSILSAIGGSPTSESRGRIGRDDPGYQSALSAVINRAENNAAPPSRDEGDTGFGSTLPGLNFDPRFRELDAQKAAAEREEVPYALRLGASAHTGLSKGMQLPSTLIRGAGVIASKFPGTIIANKIGDVAAELLPPDLREFRKRTMEEVSTGKDYFTGLAKWEDWMRRQDEALGEPDFGTQLAEGTARGFAELPIQMMSGMAGAPGSTASAIRAASTGAGVTSGLQRFGQELGEGSDWVTAAARGGTSGLITGLTTRAFGATGIESIFRKEGIPGVAGRLTRTLREAGFEAAEEATDQVQQELADHIQKNPNKPLSQSIRDVLLAGSVGAILGAGVGTLTSRGGQDASQKQKTAAVNGDVRQSGSPQVKALPVEEGGSGIFEETQGRVSLDRKISDLEQDPGVTGQRLVRIKPDGTPEYEPTLINKQKQRELENLKSLRSQGSFKPQAQGRVLSPDEQGRLNELNNKFYGGQDMDEAEMSEHKELSDRANAKPQPELEQSEEDRIIDEAITQQGIGDKIVFVSPQEIEAGGETHPMHGRTARLNEETGKIEINRREFARNIAGLPLADQVELANTLVFHENVHSHTTPEEAEDFAAGVTKWERKINDRIYLGEKGNRVRKIIGEALGDRRTGYEMIRRRLQRMNGMTPDEILQASGREKWTLQSLDMLDRIIAQARRVTPSGRGQRAKLDDIANKIGIARQALESGAAPPEEEDAPAVMTKATEKRIAKLREQRLAEIRKSEVEEIPQQDVDARIVELSNKSKEKALSEAEMDEMRDLRKERDRRESDNFPAAMSRADDVMAAPRGDDSVDAEVIESMPNGELNKLFSARDAKGPVYSPQYGSVLWGTKQPASEIPKLEAMRDAAMQRMTKAFESGDNSAFMADQGRMLWYSGALEGVRREGGNFTSAIEHSFNVKYDGKVGSRLQFTIQDAGPSNRAQFTVPQTATVDEIASKKEQTVSRFSDDSPAAMSRKDEKRLEELRKYQEAMGKRPETKRTVGLGEPVAPEERVSAEESGALPRLAAKDVDLKADQIMADAITPRKQTAEKMSEKTFQRWKRREDILQYSKLREGSIAPHQILNEAELRAKFSEAKNIKRSYDRPGFKEFAQWAKRNVGAVSPDQLRSMWEDSVWSHLVKATPERLTEWRSALGLETKYGKGFIAPELHVAEAAERQGFFGEMSAAEANEAAKRFNRQAQIRRAQNLRGVAAAERYRNKIITAIAERLIGESITERAELNRSEITNDDINFSSDKTKFGAYYDIRADVAADDKLLNRVLRDQARSSGEPESNTRRLIAVVDRKTKEVELLSTYSDAGVQRVTDPAGARLPGKPSRELNAAFLRQYRPIASILLTDPVKGFRQNFESVSEFNEKLATEAKERSAPGEFAGEGPAGEFAAEGTPGLQGEGGSFQGPHRTTMRRGTMESTGRLTVPEAVGVLEQISNEVGFFDSADDVREALEGLLDKSARGRMKARDYLAQSAYRKMINAMQREFPDMAREDVLDRLADRLYENNASSQTLDEFTQKTVAQFKGQSAPDVGPQAAPQTGGPRGRNLTTGRLPYDYVPGEGQETPSGRLGSETPVTEPYIPEVSPEQEKIQRAAADRAGKEYGVGQDWAAAFGEVDLQKRIRKGQIRVLRDRVRRQQGIRITADEAKAILEAKKGFKQPLDMTNRGIFKRAERAVGDPLRTESPAAMSRIAREAIDPDIKSPIPRLVPNIATAMTRAMGIERIPLLGRVWGPRAKIQDAADRQIIGYSVKRGIGNSQAAITATRMAALDEQLGNPFEQAADGKFTNVNKTDKDQSMYPADVFRDWQRQFIIPEKMKSSRKFTDEEIQAYSEKNPQKMRLNRKQEQYFREYLKYIEDGYKYLGEKNAKLEDYGGESKETRRDQQALYGLPKGLEVYDMPRVALHKRGMSAIEADVRKRIGASYQIEREQLYESEEVGAGTTVYEPDMNKRLATFVQRIYKSVADADLANAKELQGETADQRIPKLAKQYERELRLPIGAPGRMTQQDIVDMGYRPRLNKEAQVQDHPAFEGKIYPIEVAKKLNKFFNDRAQRYVVTAAELNTISKTLMLTGDLAQYAQQGSLLMTRHPRIWGRATAKSLKSLANPNVTGNYLNNPENMQAATELTQGGTSLGHLQDFMSGAKPGEFLTKLPGINQVITRFGRAFGTFQDIAKIETWKAMRDTTPKEEWAEVMEGIEDLGVSGRMETAGMSSARAIGERLLLMAPAYYRGAFNTVARAASEGGVAGKEARRSLAQYAAGWTMVMVTAYLAAGMSWEEIRKRLTPGQDNQKFLKFPVKMGDETVEIGPGGIILSLLNLATDTAVAAATDPKRTAAPAWQWLQQRLGPVPALARKAITQKDVFDRPTTPGKAMLEAVAPIPAQKGVAAAKGANKAAGALSATASFVGLDAKRYKAANDVYTMAQDFIEREGLKKESGFDLLANDAPSYAKMRGAVSSGSQSDFNKVLEVMSENRSHSDIRKAMKEWRDSPFTGSEKAERMFRAQLSDYEQGIYEQAQEDRARVYDKFLDMLGEAP